MLIYQCDGTEEGVLCCLFESFLKKETPVAVYSCGFQPPLDAIIKIIPTDGERAQRVRKGLIKCGGISLLSQLFYVLRSYDETKETVIFNVAARCVKEGRSVVCDYSDVNVICLSDLAHKISKEVHHAHGFLRFKECVGGLYACFEPDNDIIDLVAPHFAKRFSSEKFIIHDLKRNLVCAYDGRSIRTVPYDKPFKAVLTDEELTFDGLWKTYFKAVNIESRKNEKTQANFLPRRYRKHMNEFL